MTFVARTASGAPAEPAREQPDRRRLYVGWVRSLVARGQGHYDSSAHHCVVLSALAKTAQPVGLPAHRDETGRIELRV